MLDVGGPVQNKSMGAKKDWPKQEYKELHERTGMLPISLEYAWTSSDRVGWTSQHNASDIPKKKKVREHGLQAEKVKDK